MNENLNPAIPAKAATPGNVPAVVPTSPAGSPAPTGGQGNLSDGKVTIDMEVYRDLQRAKARTLSFDKRVAFNSKKNQVVNNPDGSPADPEIISKLNQSEEARQAAERTVLQMEVRNSVRDLLDLEEFKVLPKSTKDLILLNPSMVSGAETFEEAMLDIEDFLRNQVINIEKGAPAAGIPATPPVINAGGPAPVVPAGLEDLSKLTGTARSQAAIRNKIKQARGK